MQLSVDYAWLAAIFLMTLRLATAFMFTPVMGFNILPVRIRLFFCLAFAAAIVTGGDWQGAAAINDIGELAVASVKEVLLGGALAFGVLTAFAALSLGGRIIDFQLGFGVASLIDPATRSQSPLLGTFLSMLGAVLFLIIDGHHMLLKGLAYSLETQPLGQVAVNWDGAIMIAAFGQMFVFALAVAAPVIFGLMLVDLAIAVSARTMPQVNVYFVSLPVKIFIGLLLLSVSLSYISGFIKNLFEALILYWDRVLG